MGSKTRLSQDSTHAAIFSPRLEHFLLVMSTFKRVQAHSLKLCGVQEVSGVNRALSVGAAPMRSENWACLQEQHMLAAHTVFTPEQALTHQVEWLDIWSESVVCPLMRDRGVRYLT